MAQGSGGGAERYAAFASGGHASDLAVFPRAPQITLLGSRGDEAIGGSAGTTTANAPCKTAKNSDSAAVNRLRDTPIRKKVIGHTLRAVPGMFGERKHVRNLRGAFPLLHEPSRQHRRRILFEPLIQKRRNFLAQIGGVVQTRQLEALETVPRSREEELPGRLRRSRAHMSSVNGAEHILSKQ